MSKYCFNILAIAGAVALITGCGDKPAAPSTSTPPPAQAASAPVPAVGEVPPPAPPPPSEAGAPGGEAPVAVAPSAIDPNRSPLAALICEGKSAYFDDANGDFLPKDSVQFVERAVYAYTRIQRDEDDESKPELPPLSDLSQLVTHKIIHALPEAPPGKRFAFDPKTRKVSLN